MSALGDYSLIIAAIGGAGGFVSALGNFLLQWKSLTISQLNSTKIDNNSTKIDGNTAVTVAQGIANTVAQQAMIAEVASAKQVSVNNGAGLANAVAKIEGVDKKIDTVALAKGDAIDRISAANLARGIAEGHLAGVAAEQERIAGQTGVLRAPNFDKGG